MNKELRSAAVKAISNYMHHELYDVTQSNELLPWMKDQAENLMDGVDRAISASKMLVNSGGRK